MKENMANPKNYIGYEYFEISVDSNLTTLYVDSYEHFGWQFEGLHSSMLRLPTGTVNLKFKRDRKILNKAELTRLQRQFDSCVSEITRMEQSKARKASIIAFTIGIIGTVFMAGATFSYLGDLIVLCGLLAIPAFIGWIIPYFVYRWSYAKKTAEVTPLIESKYDEIYEVCEKASHLR